jgi:hypothetical protein
LKSEGFTNDRLRMTPQGDGFQPDFAFKTLFQNHAQRQLACEMTAVRIPVLGGSPLAYDFEQIVW